MSRGSPLEGSLTLGTAPKGARSESDEYDAVRCSPGTRRFGDDERIPVAEVGTGVG